MAFLLRARYAAPMETLQTVIVEVRVRDYVEHHRYELVKEPDGTIFMRMTVEETGEVHEARPTRIH
ncbi:MAG: hypothetical protein U1E51_23355 [Candidatus Binatia bacterium]|nr:hypothetical protein [Candidatus Binatia bacterium]